MLDSWLFAILFVGSVTIAVVVIVARLNTNLDRRDARRRNHAYPSRTRDGVNRRGR